MDNHIGLIVRCLALAFALGLAGCKAPVPLPSVSQGHAIPALDTGVVPQGLAYRADEDLMLVSGYYTDERSSVVVCMNWSTGETTNIMELQEPDGSKHGGHVGGIAISGTNLWVASGPFLYRYPLAGFPDRNEAEAISKHKTEATEEVAYCAADDRSIWAGEFALGEKYPTHPSHRMVARDGSERAGWIVAHPADRLTAATTNNIATLPTEKALSIPDRTQDILFAEEYIVLSRSYGRIGSSSIEIYENPLDDAPHRTAKTSTGQAVPLWFLDEYNLVKRIKLPPMTENIELIGNQLVVLFESGAQRYKRFGRNPQKHFLLIDLNELTAR